jgi:hypothetical protein
MPIKSNILEILISLTLIYAFLSILVSVLLEWFNHWQKSRAKMLHDTIEQMLLDPVNLSYGHLFFNHPMISGMRGKANDRPPSYISSSMFADVLIDVIAAQSRHGQKLEPVKDDKGNVTGYQKVGSVPVSVRTLFNESLVNMNASPLNDLIAGMWEKAEGDLDKLKLHIEGWFNNQMDRASGWYKTKQRSKLLIFGFAVAILLNVDTLHIVKVLSIDEGTRTKLVDVSMNVAENYEKLSDDAKKDDAALWEVLKASVPDSLKSDTSLLKKHMGRVKDSLSLEYLLKADSVLGLAAGLNMPIGWNMESAPKSWDLKCLFCSRCCPPERHPKRSTGLIAYNQHRNECSTWGNLLMYLLGITISGISLSFGAPFWFELLVKFVNIRKAGVKPKVAKKEKK